MAAVTFDGTSATQISLAGPFSLTGSWTIEILFTPNALFAAPANGTQALFSAWNADLQRQNLHVGYFDDGRVKIAFYGDDLIVPLSTYSLTQGQPVRILFGYTAVTDESYIQIAGTEIGRSTAGPFTPAGAIEYWFGARKNGVEIPLATVQTLIINGVTVFSDLAPAAPAFPDHGAMSVAAAIKTTNSAAVAFPALSGPVPNNLSVTPSLSVANPLLTSMQFTAENMGGMAITQEGLPLYVKVAFGGGDTNLPFTLPGTVGAQSTGHLMSITPQVPYYVPVSLAFPSSKGALVVDPFLFYVVRYVHYHASGGTEPAGNGAGAVTSGRGDAAVPDQREDGAVPEPRSDGTLV